MRIPHKDIKRVTAKYYFETNDKNVEPVVAGLTVEFSDEMEVSQMLLLQMHANIAEAFRQFIIQEVV